MTHRDDGQSGFSVTFSIGRAGPAALMDYALLSNPLLRPFNRVIVMVTFNAMPHVLMDGMITRQELAQGTEPGTSTLTIKGEDVSVAMDREEHSVEHPAQNEMLIAGKLILSYAQYGLIPIVIPPAAFDVPLPIERIPVQQGTDLDYLRKLAEVHGYVFYVAPGAGAVHQLRLLGPADPRRPAAARDHGEHGPGDERQARPGGQGRARAGDGRGRGAGPLDQPEGAGEDVRQPAAAARLDAVVAGRRAEPAHARSCA